MEMTGRLYFRTVAGNKTALAGIRGRKDVDFVRAPGNQWMIHGPYGRKERNKYGGVSCSFNLDRYERILYMDEAQAAALEIVGEDEAGYFNRYLAYVTDGADWSDERDTWNILPDGPNHATIHPKGVGDQTDARNSIHSIEMQGPRASRAISTFLEQALSRWRFYALVIFRPNASIVARLEERFYDTAGVRTDSDRLLLVAARALLEVAECDEDAEFALDANELLLKFPGHDNLETFVKELDQSAYQTLVNALLQVQENSYDSEDALDASEALSLCRDVFESCMEMLWKKEREESCEEKSNEQDSRECQSKVSHGGAAVSTSYSASADSNKGLDVVDAAKYVLFFLQDHFLQRGISLQADNAAIIESGIFLQTLLFVSDCIGVSEHGSRWFSEQPQAWRDGPCYPRARDFFHHIRDALWTLEQPCEVDAELKRTLDSIIKKTERTLTIIPDESSNKLVQTLHKTEFWTSMKELMKSSATRHPDRPISSEDISATFRGGDVDHGVVELFVEPSESGQ